MFIIPSQSLPTCIPTPWTIFVLCFMVIFGKKLTNYRERAFHGQYLNFPKITFTELIQ